MKHTLIFFTICLAFFISCKKDTSETITDTPNIANAKPKYYYPLAVGNYWVYNEIIIDSLGNETPTSKIDSVYIDKDTIINGATYYGMFYKDIYNLNGSYSYSRDSASFRVFVSFEQDSTGQTTFYYYVGKQFTHQVNDTTYTYTDPSNLYSRYIIVSAPASSLSLPAGTFTNLYTERTDIY